ncbi:MAG: Teichuronic acid biosynthesis protein TuaB [Chroococcidiopsis cubana SAG 39.79]|uniref:Teichuronic acid biosynthesis protein TuaB n=1 Tax=Chroococcidiopsis cubana SAG 39.79 TaxID=388085 RepID=A0AB37UAF9_9CYAN|nr:lipopolysaccharide biosynthesis protein [Chroococcidiopsis cubana]MDZ4874831.1 Teichuronic acid biosynthesis protein TuaB [Chroococcidiopsis cubana SAG 39.79]PSB64026.1 lipopolysaccharide biosynthesis protein [Chroococcidiopsis cubana CCALA 043]RUT01933.1 teichuronic acid biosynthesis protein TuaB [Chroococcidiopsis cubana SAG 39.79]
MLINKLKQISSGQFIRNVGWLGGAELANRIFRLGTTVTLARMFSAQDYGQMAVVYTIFDFATVFTLRGGIGTKIVQADREDVKTICNTSYWLNWILCGSIFIIQCLAAIPIAQFYGNNQLIWLLCTSALIYLMMPLYMVHSALLQRENRLKITAIANATQSLLGNFMTVTLALGGMGIWAIVLPMVLTTPVWIVINWKNHSWRPPKLFSLEKWQEVTYFGKNLLLVEVLNKLRGNLDYLIIGRFIGIEALGVYYFAFNAGSGISMNVINAFMSALFPHICTARTDYEQFKKRYFTSLKKVSLFVIPFIVLQSSLAPLYVPIIFGKKWLSVIPILIMICLSGIPRIFAWASNLLLNALNKTHITLYLNIFFTIFFAISILIAVNWGIFGVAVAVLISHLFVLPVLTIWTHQYIFNKHLFSHKSFQINKH